MHDCEPVMISVLDLANTEQPDEKSIMTYVSSLYEVFPKEPTVQESLQDNVSILVNKMSSSLNFLLIFFMDLKPKK